jgi:hypothetical protein
MSGRKRKKLYFDQEVREIKGQEYQQEDKREPQDIG